MRILIAIVVAGFLHTSLFAATAAKKVQNKGARSKPAPSASTIAFLRECNIDPASPDVAAAAATGTVHATILGEEEDLSLESLAKAKKKGAVIRFVATRGYIARLKKNYAATPPPGENYEAAFLKPEERQIVGRKVAENLKNP